MEHTELPWPNPQYDNYGNGSFHEWWEVEGICRVYDEANAQFIVKAANAHEELVEALTAIKARIDGEWDNPALERLGLLTVNGEEDILAILKTVETLKED